MDMFEFYEMEMAGFKQAKGCACGSPAHVQLNENWLCETCWGAALIAMEAEACLT